MTLVEFRETSNGKPFVSINPNFVVQICPADDSSSIGETLIYLFDGRIVYVTESYNTVRRKLAPPGPVTHAINGFKDREKK